MLLIISEVGLFTLEAAKGSLSSLCLGGVCTCRTRGSVDTMIVSSGFAVALGCSGGGRFRTGFSKVFPLPVADNFTLRDLSQADVVVNVVLI